MKNMIVVYGKNSGAATVASFLGNQWWVTAKDQPLEPLINEDKFGQSDYRYLCEKGAVIQMKDLAGIMGSVIENADDYNMAMKDCLKELTSLGVKFQAVPQVLNLEFSVSKIKCGANAGLYRIGCHDRDVISEPLIYLDYFETPQMAWELGRAYIDFFMRHGVKVVAELECAGIIAEELGNIQGVKLGLTDND